MPVAADPAAVDWGVLVTSHLCDVVRPHTFAGLDPHEVSALALWPLAKPAGDLWQAEQSDANSWAAAFPAEKSCAIAGAAQKAATRVRKPTETFPRRAYNRCPYAMRPYDRTP